jgi:hypothetical protein
VVRVREALTTAVLAPIERSESNGDSRVWG